MIIDQLLSTVEPLDPAKLEARPSPSLGRARPCPSHWSARDWTWNSSSSVNSSSKRARLTSPVTHNLNRIHMASHLSGARLLDEAGS